MKKLFTLSFALLIASITLGQVKNEPNEKTMTENLNEVAAFLKDCRVFFIATSEGNQPRVRPFGVAEIVNGKLYLTTGRKKDVYKQLEGNDGRFEICALKADYSQWIRISGRLVDEDNAEIRQTILDRNKSLGHMYSANDGNFVTPYIADGEARFFSFQGEEKRMKF